MAWYTASTQYVSASTFIHSSIPTRELGLPPGQRSHGDLHTCVLCGGGFALHMQPVNVG